MDADRLKEETAHKQELKRNYTNRLRALEQQAARYGKDCPPHVLVEIGEINDKLRTIDEDISNTQRVTKSDVDTLYSQARQYYLRGDIGYALQLYSQVKQMSPNYPRIDIDIQAAKREMKKGYVDRYGIVVNKDVIAGNVSNRAHDNVVGKPIMKIGTLQIPLLLIILIILLLIVMGIALFLLLR